MEYGALISRALAITWQHKYLWVLGLLAGLGTSSCNFGSGAPPIGDTPGGTVPGAPDTFSSDAEELFIQVGRFLEANVELIVLTIVLLLVLGIALWLVSLVAQGGLMGAVDRIEAGERPTLRSAWRLGVERFWSLLGLWLAVLVIAFGVAAVIGIAVFVLAVVLGLAAAGGDDLGAGTVLLLVLLGLIGFVVFLVVAIAAGIIVTLAQRAVVIDRNGPFAALGTGWRILRTRLGDALLLWLISVGLLVVAGIGIALLLAIPGVPIAMVAVGVLMTEGLTFSTILAVALLGIAFILFAMLVSSPVSTFFWTYWTLAYLRLTGR